MILLDERIPFALHVIERIEQESFDGHAISALPFHFLLSWQLELAGEVVEEARDADRLGRRRSARRPHIARVCRLVDG